MAVRPAALTVAGGGLGGIFLQALLEGFRSSDSSPGLLAPPEPYYPPEPWASESWHLPSLLTGDSHWIVYRPCLRATAGPSDHLGHLASSAGLGLAPSQLGASCATSSI